MPAIVQELRPPPAHPSFRHVEVLPGEQSQIDWGHLGRFPIDAPPKKSNARTSVSLVEDGV